jgi:hypothetical protein
MLGTFLVLLTHVSVTTAKQTIKRKGRRRTLYITHTICICWRSELDYSITSTATAVSFPLFSLAIAINAPFLSIIRDLPPIHTYLGICAIHVEKWLELLLRSLMLTKINLFLYI